MTRQYRRRFRIELATGVGSAALAVVTLVWPDWIEFVFGVDPDHGNGSLEAAIVVAPSLVSMEDATGSSRVASFASDN